MGLGRTCILMLASAALSFGGQAAAGDVAVPDLAVVPQIGVVSRAERSELQLRAVAAHIDIDTKSATTTLQSRVHNTSRRAIRPTLFVPVPAGTVLPPANRRQSPTTLIPAKSARPFLERWMKQTRCAALSEFMGFDWIRVEADPVPAGQTSTLQVSYRQRPASIAERVDYLLPRSQLLSYKRPWTITANVRSERGISTVYSPSHELAVARKSATELTLRTTKTAAGEPGAFRMTWLKDTGRIAATLLACPSRSGRGGYFLLLLGPPAASATPMKREITFVIDRSASMKGRRLEQVRASVQKVVQGMNTGEAINVIQYNHGVHSFANSAVDNNDRNVSATRRYLNGIDPRGGTNMYAALRASLQQPPSSGKLPIVLFFTDGLPTTGNTSEADIRKLVQEQNPHRRRIYTFGVGVDVKTPLLEGIAAASRGRATFVLPGENIDRKVTEVVERLKRPVLAAAQLEIARTGGGQPADNAAYDLLPSTLPDLFQGDRLVVLGRYRGSRLPAMRLRGNYLGKPAEFPIKTAGLRVSREHDFIRRLWASRKIAQLIDDIRQSGAHAKPSYAARGKPVNKQIASRVGEILKLTAEHGVVTEYTAFLARAPGNWSTPAKLKKQVTQQLDQRAVQIRAGYASVSQEFNRIEQKGQRRLNGRNTLFNARMKRETFDTVQQLGPDSFFLRNGTWVEGRLLLKGATPAPQRTISFGSAAYFALLRKLEQTGRQGALALAGNVFLSVNGELVRVNGPLKRK